MSLFERSSFDAFVRGFTGTTLTDQWDARVAKVSEESFEILTSLAGVSQAPYFAKRKWVTVEPNSELGQADLQEYLTRSYRTVSASLTRKLRAELGIAD